MKNSFTLLVAAIVAICLGVYMFCFQVDYNEAAVVVTLGHAEPPQRDPDTGELIDPGSVRTEPRLYFKWPWPIQQVRRYPTTNQSLTSQAVEITTDDQRNVVVQTYLVWRIADPYAFSTTLEDMPRGRERLRDLMASANTQFSDFTLDQFVNRDPEQVKLREMGRLALEQIRESVREGGYGIEVLDYRIVSNRLPEQATQAVLDRMTSDRQGLADRERSRGEAEAEAIRGRARAAVTRIESFARAQADEIQAAARREVAPLWEIYERDPEFAEELRFVQNLPAMIGENAMFILPERLLRLDRVGGQRRAPAPESPVPPVLERLDAHEGGFTGWPAPAEAGGGEQADGDANNEVNQR